MLSDPSPSVVVQALITADHLATHGVAEMLWRADRSEWTPTHDMGVLALLRPGPRRSPRTDWWLFRTFVHVPVDLYTVLTLEAGDRAERAPESDRGSVFSGFPSLIEKAFLQLVESRPPVAEWLSHMRMWAGSARNQPRWVARRLLTMLGQPCPTALEVALCSPSRSEAVSAAECLLRSGDEASLVAVMAKWQDAFQPAMGPDGWRDAPDHLPERLVWALEGATVDAAPLLVLALKDLQYDNDNFGLLEESEELVHAARRCVRRWGARGAIALVGLMDKGLIDKEWQFEEEVGRAYVRSAEVREAVDARAAAGGKVSLSVRDAAEADAANRNLGAFAARIQGLLTPAAASS
jgi:hypothetical protein